MRNVLATEILVYQTSVGKQPFTEWKAKQSLIVRATIDGRLERVKAGIGDFKGVGEGVLELRIHLSPGFRVYFALIDTKIILLLCAGDKSKQDADIKKAQRYLKDFRERT